MGKNLKVKQLKPYEVLFVCKGREYKSVLNEEERCFQINNVQIEVEFDGSLYIENPADYKKSDFSFLHYKNKHNTLFLQEYEFYYNLPLYLYDTKAKKAGKTNFEGAITEKNGKTEYLWTILDKTSDKTDIDCAILDLQEKLYPNYEIQCCCCCKYGQENPYGGDPYMNFICFIKNKPGYEALGIANKADWSYFQNNNNVADTRPLYRCENFAFRKSLVQKAK